ncbi:MAG TPA: hypothetical protein VMF08_18510 [Candidatus Sulfotelmatobacter sp.]|nr:hypothetical protein [Candidatus Sulfotelmatobacter sp.]
MDIDGLLRDSASPLRAGLFIESNPQDIIDSQPLHYRRTEDGKFLLYSVGWNEIDDGGQEVPSNQDGWVTDFSKGDWVWGN